MAGDSDKEDLALFRQAMAREGVRKAKPQTSNAAPNKPKPLATARTRKPPPARTGDIPADQVTTAVTNSVTDQTQPGEPVLFVRAGVDKNRVRQLKRNRIVVDERIDLHGMRESEATRALVRFFHECRFYSWNCVQIIHGKGRNSEQPGGVLRPLTIHWLKQQPEVVAFCSASTHDGGTGATNVLLAGDS